MIEALLAQPLAVVGDSMARQAFMTLVARLRGAEHVVDFNVHYNVVHRMYVAPTPGHSDSYARVADGLGLSHLSLDWLHTEGDAAAATTPTNSTGSTLMASRQRNRAMPPQTSVFDWAAARVTADWQATMRNEQRPRVARTATAFYWAPCSYMMPDAARQLRLVGGPRAGGQRSDATNVADSASWGHVVYFAPSYWHLTGACGAKAGLNATAEAVMRMWLPLIKLSNVSVVTVVSAPTENVPDALRPKLLAQNAELKARFTAGDFPANWRLYDWAALMSKARLPTVAPHGDQKQSWHYACQFYRTASWYTMSTHHNITVMTKARSGDCSEEANTMLWSDVLLGERRNGQDPPPSGGAWLSKPRVAMPRAMAHATSRGNE